MSNIHLPTIEIIGGDTCPFSFDLRDMAETHIATQTCEATLTIVSYVNRGQAVWHQTKTNVVVSGDSILTFDIPSETSRKLRGKYIYQLQLSNGVNTELYEGHLVVYANNIQ